ncbi:MAG TPA: hypothetical protein VMT34_11025 [Aggregatilineales bacterium]|nr:hypothetical protein [Aggregatilineales bacterium]
MEFGLSGDKAPNLEEFMQLGIRTAKDGNMDNARVIFQKVLDSDKHNERAWLWMAYVAENDTKRRQYLETVLRLNPNNLSAHKYLDAMDAAVDRVEGNSMTLGFMILGALVVILVLIGVVIYLSTNQAASGSGLGYFTILLGGVLIGLVTLGLVVFVIARR